jgi:ABC-type spermidine/putrescine transport system permease subunit II
MSKSLSLQVAALVAAVSLTLGTVAGMNALATDTYRTVSEAQLASTPMAFAQHVTVVGHRSSHA